MVKNSRHQKPRTVIPMGRITKPEQKWGAKDINNVENILRNSRKELATNANHYSAIHYFGTYEIR